MKVSEILDRAADLIEPEGAWTKGSFGRTAAGHGIGACERRAACWCGVGGIYRVAGYSSYGGAQAIVAADAYATKRGFRHFAAFNDAEGRTQQEVVTALREAARKEREAGR